MDKKYYEVVTTLNKAVVELQTKTKEQFCPKNKTCGFLVIPKNKSSLLDLENEYGFSVRKYISGAWPLLAIVEPNELRVVYKDGHFCEGDLDENTCMLIDCKGYGNDNYPESFVTFEL